MEAIRAVGVIRIATNPGIEPMEFLRGDQLIGYDIDFGAELAKHLNVEVEWVVFDRLEELTLHITEGLSRANFDVAISAMGIDEKRTRNSIAVPYFKSGLTIITTTTNQAVSKLVGEARGKIYFDRFRDQIAIFIGREETLLSERRSEFQTAKGAVSENFGLVRDTTGWVDHTHEVLAAAAQLLADAVDMETGMRGYLLAGKDEFLAPYQAGKTAFFEDIAILQITVDDNPAQVERLQQMAATIAEWIEKVTEPAIALRRQVSGGERPLQDIEVMISRKAGKQYFDAFRAQIAAFSQLEKDLMAERQETAAGAGTKVSADLGVMNRNEGWVTHTYGVIGQANAILAAAVDMETGMRGYLLSGQEEFLAPYTGGAMRFHELVAILRESVQDNPAQVELLNEAEQTIREWQSDFTEPTIALRRGSGDAETMNDTGSIGSLRGKRVAAVVGSTEHDIARSVPGAIVVDVVSYDQCVAAVLNGEADAAVLDVPVALTAAKRHPGLRVANYPFEEEWYGVYLPDSAKGLFREIRRAVKKMRRDGTMDALNAEWF